MIKKSLHIVLLAFTFTIVLFACKKPDDIPEPPKEEQEYYPLEKGKWVIYDVDSTVWDDTFCIERTYSYQVRHIVADTFTDDAGRPSFRVEAYKRVKIEDEWVPQTVFYATNTGVTLEIVQDQLRFIKMVFPISEGEEWEGNSYILTRDPDYSFYADWMYEYQKVGEGFNTGSKVFEKTITVEQRNEAISDPELFTEEFASRTSSREIYASGVGMIYREYIRWTYDPNTTKCRKGVGVVMRATDHN